MLSKIVPFAALLAQTRWKVEFFCREGGSSDSARYPTVTLKDVLRERGEALNPQAFPAHVFNYLGLEHVQSVTGDLVDYKPREGRQVLSRSKVFHHGDLLYGRLRPSLNKVFVADEFLPEGICSGEFYVLVRDPSRIRPHFARALLASRYVQDTVRTMTTGSALPRLQLDDLLAIKAPLPSLAEQAAVEEILLEQRRRRLRIARELAVGPGDALKALVTMLEGGAPFALEDFPEEAAASYAQHALPAGPGQGERSRGRPRKQRDGTALFE